MIYDPIGADLYEGVACVDEADHLIFSTFDGTPRAPNWRPVLMERYASDIDGGNKPSDFPWMGCLPLIMRRRAVFALRDMLEAGGEILPLATNDGVDLFVLNVTRVIDALDEERSDLTRFPDSNKIMAVWAPAFHEPMIRGVDFFKLPMRSSCLLVGDYFVERVREAGLEGLDFTPVWSPETGPIRRRPWW